MNNELLTSISEKLQQATRTSIQERRKEKQEAEQQTVAIEDALHQRAQRDAAEIDNSRERLNQLGQLLDETVRGMAVQSAKEAEKVAALREELETQVELLQKDHQDKVETIVDASEERIAAVNDELDKKSRTQREKLQSFLTSLAKRLIATQREFREQAENRAQGQQRLKGHFYDEVAQFKEVVERERERRVSSERKMQAMMEEIEEKLAQEVEGLTARRKRNNESMLKLIELACQKIEDKYQE